MPRKACRALHASRPSNLLWPLLQRIEVVHHTTIIIVVVVVTLDFLLPIHHHNLFILKFELNYLNLSHTK